jgi:hypothetical protein
MTHQRLPPGRKICFAEGRGRIQIDVESCDLAVPHEDEVLAGVARRLAPGPRAPSQASGVLQHLGLPRWRIDVVGMHAPKITRELVESIVSYDSAGGSVHDCILSVDFADCGPPALRVILAEDLGDVAPQ